MTKIWILVSKPGKSKLIQVPQKTGDLLRVLKVFFPPNTPVKLTKSHTFEIKNIDPFAKPPPPENGKLL